MFSQALVDRYRCGKSLAEFELSGELSSDKGFFRFGDQAICYGSSTDGSRLDYPCRELYDTSRAAQTQACKVTLPFDPNEVIDNLRLERYAHDHNLNGSQSLAKKVLRSTYYSLRPLFPVSVRRHIQKIYLRGWDKRYFPNWPVDRTVEILLEENLKLAMQAQGVREVPFIWYWPDGQSACALMTHDVETTDGRDFCSTLMDINEAFQIKASFQVVPEKRYTVSESYLSSIRDRGFEVAVQDLNHDGHLYSNREEFLRRAALIRQYKEQFRASGFRAAVLYRNLDWMQELGFSYDMSVPNVAHLDPQSGGCCTVFPYFIGDTLELPVTTIQDYSLFNILGQYNTDLWRAQADLILEKNGLIHFIVHPDYVIADRPQKTYKDLLAYISKLRSEKNVWVTLPKEVDRWWRARSQMKLVPDGNSWHIEGPEKERASLAFARVENGGMVFRRVLE